MKNKLFASLQEIWKLKIKYKQTPVQVKPDKVKIEPNRARIEAKIIEMKAALEAKYKK